MLLTAFQRKVFPLVLELSFSNGDELSKLIEFFRNMEVTVMLEVMDSEPGDMMFPFVAGFVDCVIGCAQPALMIPVHKMYKEPVNRRTKDRNEEEASLGMVFDVEGSFQRLKETMRKYFDEHREEDYITLSFTGWKP